MVPAIKAERPVSVQLADSRRDARQWASRAETCRWLDEMNRRSCRWRSFARRYGDRAGRQPMVARVDHGMIPRKIGPDEVRK